MTVAELGQRISSKEITEWQLYYRMEPFGEERMDIRSAMICHTVYSMLRSNKAPDMTLDDFIPKFTGVGVEDEERGDVGSKSSLEALAAALGAAVADK